MIFKLRRSLLGVWTIVLLIKQCRPDPVTNREIRVMISEHIPFGFFQENNIEVVPDGLDVLILENFAKKYGIRVEFIATNESLNTILHSEMITKDIPEVLDFL